MQHSPGEYDFERLALTAQGFSIGSSDGSPTHQAAKRPSIASSMAQMNLPPRDVALPCEPASIHVSTKVRVGHRTVGLRRLRDARRDIDVAGAPAKVGSDEPAGDDGNDGCHEDRDEDHPEVPEPQTVDRHGCAHAKPGCNQKLERSGRSRGSSEASARAPGSGAAAGPGPTSGGRPATGEAHLEIAPIRHPVRSEPLVTEQEPLARSRP